MKYLKKFATHEQYLAYINGSDALLPNVSLCVNKDDVHYNPYISPYNGQDYIDLSLPSGTIWAKMNVGANSITDSGLLFAWGETTGYNSQGHTFSEENYRFYDNNNYTKYNYTDELTTLELSDDAAHINMGGDWHMPNEEQIKELIGYTTNGFVTLNGDFVQYRTDSTDYSYKYAGNGIYYNNGTYNSQDIVGTSTGNKFNGVEGYLFFNAESDLATALANDEFLFIPGAAFSVWSGVTGSWGLGYALALTLENEGGTYYSHTLYEDVYDYRWEGKYVRGVIGEIEPSV